VALPQLQPGGQGIGSVFTQMQTLWAAIINPVVDRPQNKSTILTSITLAVGDNIIPHTLNRALIGWGIVRQRSGASIYDKQDSNENPTVNLVLNSDAIVTIDLEVF
jgi:hypothetical protein